MLSVVSKSSESASAALACASSVVCSRVRRCSSYSSAVVSAAAAMLPRRASGFDLDVGEAVRRAVIQHERGVGRRRRGAERHGQYRRGCLRPRRRRLAPAPARTRRRPRRRSDPLNGTAAPDWFELLTASVRRRPSETPSKERILQTSCCVEPPDGVAVRRDEIAGDAQHRGNHVVDLRRPEQRSGCGDDSEQPLLEVVRGHRRRLYPSDQRSWVGVAAGSDGGFVVGRRIDRRDRRRGAAALPLAEARVGHERFGFGAPPARVRRRSGDGPACRPS